MQDPRDPVGIAEPEENGHGNDNDEDSPVAGDPAPNSDGGPAASMVLAEVLPGVAAVFGEVPAELKLGLIDFGLVPAADRRQLSTVLAAIGNSATAGGNLGSALASAQGLYRIGGAAQALLKAGGTLAVKDGANLGAVFLNGKLVAQARFIPVAAVSASQAAASLGPALAMVALQLQLSEISGLVRSNIALTSQVLKAIRHEQWAELTGLAAAVDRVVAQAREVESVPASLWDNVAGSEASLRKQFDLYRRNVADHVQQIGRLGAAGRREYLEINAEAILFDANALLTAVKAWIGYQALRAGRARTAGPDDAAEARLVDVISRDARKEFDSAFTETTSLIDSLTRELRIIAELPGRATVPLTQKRKDSKASRLTCAQLLEAIEPLAVALHPAAPPLQAPDVMCAPGSPDVEPYLRILRWLMEDGETLRGLGFPYQRDARDVVAAVGQTALRFARGLPIGSIPGLGQREWAAAIDDMEARALIAVTDRRIITAPASALLQQGQIGQEIPIDRVRYVRVTTKQDESARSAINLTTPEQDIEWLFHSNTDDNQVNALAALLAEAMTIPDAERERLELPGQPPATAAAESNGSDAEPTGPREP